MRAIAALDPGFLANPADPLVATGRDVARTPRLLALETSRIDIVPPSEKAAEQRNLVGGRAARMHTGNSARRLIILNIAHGAACRTAHEVSTGAIPAAGRMVHDIRSCLDTEGLWTLSRGLARAKPAYFQHLQAADHGRTNDFDGRGKLSDATRSSFCRFFLERVLDQIDFMTGLISPFKLLDPIESYLRFTRVDLDGKMRDHLARLLKALCLEGEVPRGRVPAILGLKGTASRVIIRRALDEGLVSSSSEKGLLRIAFPNKVVDSYFPMLFTDLPVDGA